jgi:hypothetical protein
MPDHSWHRTESDPPPTGVVVRAMDSGGHVQDLVFEGNLWWFPDRSMYVYFRPVFWTEAPATDNRKE